MFYPWTFSDYSPVTIKKHNHFPKLWLFISAVIVTYSRNKNANEKSHVGFCSVRDSRDNLASGRWKIKIVGLCFANYRFLKQ